MTTLNLRLSATLISAALLTAGLAGCANMNQTQQDTARGAGVGAAAGAVLGALTGGSKGATRGAVLGGAVGAGGGYLWSQKMQEQKTAMEKATVGTGVAVTPRPRALGNMLAQWEDEHKADALFIDVTK